MAREIVDIRKFVATANRKDAQHVRIKKTPSFTKFKIRGSRFLYTFKVNSKEQAEKLLKALPAGLKKTELK